MHFSFDVRLIVKFLCRSGGKHVPRATLVDLEPTVIGTPTMKLQCRNVGTADWSFYAELAEK